MWTIYNITGNFLIPRVDVISEKFSNVYESCKKQFCVNNFQNNQKLRDFLFWHNFEKNSQTLITIEKRSCMNNFQNNQKFRDLFALT